MEYDDPHHWRVHCAVTSKVNGQAYNVMKSVWRVFAHNGDKEKLQKHENWQEGWPCHGWQPHQFQDQKVKSQGHQAA